MAKNRQPKRSDKEYIAALKLELLEAATAASAERNLASTQVRTTRTFEFAAFSYRRALERLVCAFEQIESCEEPGGLLSLGGSLENARRVLLDTEEPPDKWVGQE